MMSRENDELIEIFDTGRMPAPLEDKRPRMPEPLPVRLVAVADVRVIAPAGAERELDSFYVDLLSFERDANKTALIYHAENFAVIFHVQEPPVEREDMRALGIELLHFSQIEQKLIDAEIEYTRQKSLVPGVESLLLRDPAGNWIELVPLHSAL